MQVNYALFEANDIHRATRYRMARLNGVFWGTVLITIGSALLSRTLVVVSPVVLGVSLGAFVLVAAGVSWRHYALSRTVWCVKVMAESVIGYDCARRKTVLPWHEVQQIDLSGETLWIIQSSYHAVGISTSFDDFSTLSHQILQHAEPHGVTICIEGRPLDELDVYALCPFLTNEPPTDAAEPPS